MLVFHLTNKLRFEDTKKIPKKKTERKNKEIKKENTDIANPKKMVTPTF